MYTDIYLKLIWYYMSVITQFTQKREDFLLSRQHSRTSLTWVGFHSSPVAATVKSSLRHPSSVSRGRCHSEAQNNMFFILSHTHAHTHTHTHTRHPGNSVKYFQKMQQLVSWRTASKSRCLIELSWLGPHQGNVKGQSILGIEHQLRNARTNQVMFSAVSHTPGRVPDT